MKQQDIGENCIMKSFMSFTLHTILLSYWNVRNICSVLATTCGWVVGHRYENNIKVECEDLEVGWLV